MCLQPEWFLQREERRKDRDRHGVSIRDAEECLLTYDSTVSPVAVEMAEWISANWPEQKINRLSKEARDIYRRILEDLSAPDEEVFLDPEDLSDV